MEARPYKKIYLDSSFFLAHLKKETIVCEGGLQRWEITSAILDDAEHKRCDVFTSAATLSEVRRIRPRNVELDLAELQTIHRLFENEYFHVMDVIREIGEKAGEFGALYGIQPFDAIHLASAVFWKCEAVFAWDKPLVEIMKGIAVEGVVVVEPTLLGKQLPLLLAPPADIPVDVTEDILADEVEGAVKEDEQEAISAPSTEARSELTSDVESSTQLEVTTADPTANAPLAAAPQEARDPAPDGAPDSPPEAKLGPA